MAGHARLSPSAASRWMACPASVREEAALPEDNRSKPAAIDGTHSHTLLERCLRPSRELKKESKYVEPSVYLGQEMKDHDGSFVVDADRISRVKIAYDYIMGRCAEIIDVNSKKEHAPFYEPLVMSEIKVNPGQYIGRDDLAGTADSIVVGNGTLEVIDYKDGMGEVLAENNPQMTIYALGALKQYGHMYGVHTVKMTIIQPKMQVFGKNPISSWTVPASYLTNEFEPQLSAKAQATDDPNAPYVPGESQCKWCRVKGSCKALATKAMEEAQIMFEHVNIAQQAADKNPNELSNDEIAKLIESKPLIQQFLDSVETEALERFKKGQKVPGLKVVRGRGSRAWSQDESEMAEVLRKAGVPKNEVYVKKLVSPAQLPKHKWTTRSGETKTLTERQIKRIEENYIESKPGKLTIALESDSRSEVPMDAESMFKDVKVEAATTVIPQETTSTDLPDWLK